jgi:hypothetical protein
VLLINNQKLEKLIDGRAKFTSHNLGFNLLISRLQSTYAKKRTPDEMSNCVRELRAFMEKYNSIMAAEIDAINGI